MNSILFICALAQEKQALVEQLPERIQKHHLDGPLNIEVEQFKQAQLDIYLCESGMGNLNAGVKLALILQKIAIDQVVLIGVAGALHSSLNIGDMVLSNQVIQHDYYSSLHSGNYLMQPGDLILDPNQSLNYDPIQYSLPSSIEIDTLRHSSIPIIEGLVASGNEFVGTSVRKQEIYQQCRAALIVDMEAAAIATIANQYQIPFIIAKTVSDKVHTDGSISNDFNAFLGNASRNAAIIATLLISQAISTKKE